MKKQQLASTPLLLSKFSPAGASKIAPLCTLLDDTYLKHCERFGGGLIRENYLFKYIRHTCERSGMPILTRQAVAAGCASHTFDPNRSGSWPGVRGRIQTGRGQLWNELWSYVTLCRAARVVAPNHKFARQATAAAPTPHQLTPNRSGSLPEYRGTSPRVRCRVHGGY